MNAMSKIRSFCPPLLPVLYLIAAYSFDIFFLRTDQYLQCINFNIYDIYDTALQRLIVSYAALFISILIFLSFIYYLPKIGKHLFALLCCLSFCICMSYLDLLGRFPNDSDLAAAIMAITTRHEEISGFFSSFFPVKTVVF